jgi:hypothetical protein
MAISVKHLFTSAKADGTDSTLVQPSNWNAEHTITLAAGKVLGRSSASAGAMQELPLSIDSTGQSMIPPIGTTGERPATAATGMFRFNTTTTSFEGYNGAAWGSIGGGGGATGGGTDTVFFNNNNAVTTNYTIPSSTVTGTGGVIGPSSTTMTIASGGPFTVGMLVTGTGVTAGTYISAVTNATTYTVTQSQSVTSTTLTGTANSNSGTFGPVTVASGATVTVPSGSTWSIV